jgi:hypothetical protein
MTGTRHPFDRRLRRRQACRGLTYSATSGLSSTHVVAEHAADQQESFEPLRRDAQPIRAGALPPSSPEPSSLTSFSPPSTRPARCRESGSSTRLGGFPASPTDPRMAGPARPLLAHPALLLSPVGDLLRQEPVLLGPRGHHLDEALLLVQQPPQRRRDRRADCQQLIGVARQRRRQRRWRDPRPSDCHRLGGRRHLRSELTQASQRVAPRGDAFRQSHRLLSTVTPRREQPYRHAGVTPSRCAASTPS